MTGSEKENLYHYKTCGLDYVYLLNGFERHATRDGPGVSIHNLDELHRVVAVHLVSLKRELTGKEFRFLRIQLDMSQKALGAVFNKTDQAVAKWEKGNKVPREVDIILRHLYMESIGENPLVSDIIRQINDLDRVIQKFVELRLEESNEGWREVA